MSEQRVLVYMETPNGPILTGTLWTRRRGARQSASFEYDDAWLRNPECFALEPALGLAPGPFHTPSDKPLFGAIGDSAPDRWGRVLMRREERRRATAAKETPRSLSEIDYLLLVDDESRQGALRFALEDGGPFLAHRPEASIPPLIDLSRLLTAADSIGRNEETDEDIRLLLAPGSSLGGARPKASVRDSGGGLAIAKFPHTFDEIDSVRWEAIALSLAGDAGIRIPAWRLQDVAGRPVLLLRRFDRVTGQRIPFISAMSMLGATDGDSRSYLEFVDVLRQHGARPKADMHELFRRVVFTVLISNTDDHLRNHGFLYAGPDGWELSPAYDLNPVPTDLKPRVLSTAIDMDDATASLELAFSVAPYFELTIDQAREIASEVGQVVATWRAVAAGLGVARSEIERMASAFEHDDLGLAVRGAE